MTRAEEWQRRLAHVRCPSVIATQLYAGDHWHWALQAYRSARRWTDGVQLWVVSAGYGLFRADTAIKPYSATFASGHADLVWRGWADGDRRGGLRAWWEAMSRRAGIADLVSTAGEGTVLLAVGSTYINALHDDLAAAMAADETREGLAVISAGTRSCPGLLPVDAKHSSVVGGPLVSLNARVLALLASRAGEHAFQPSLMSRVLQGSIHNVRDRAGIARLSASNEAIMAAVQAMRSDDPSLTWTKALRLLRSSGVACAQGRLWSIWNMTNSA